MKTYIQTVKVDISCKDDFISNIKNELASEKQQYKITQARNKATTTLHKKILKDLCDTMNTQLSKVGLSFDFERGHTVAHAVNEYEPQYAILVLDKTHTSCVIKIEGQRERNHQDSKYITFTGEYIIRIGKNHSTCFRANQDEYLKSTVKNIDEIFEYIRHEVKKYCSR